MRLDDFFNCFFPDRDEPIFLRGFSPKGIPKELGVPVYGQKITRKELLGSQELQKTLIEINKRQGLYFTPNSGGFKEFEINRFNAVFCEIDNIPIIDQLDLYENGPLSPSICVETRKSIHTYWLLEDRESVSAEDWVLIQRGLIDHFKSDAGIKNPNRVMRLPFFSHIHWDGSFHYKKVNVVKYQPSFTYTLAELKEAFPTIHKTENLGEGFTNNLNSANIHDVLKIAISQHPTYSVESDGIHATCQGICHNAKYGKTAIMVNLKSGAVFCHAGCNYWTIANAFGIQKPASRGGFEPKFVGRRDQTSLTADRLREYVYGTDNNGADW